MSARTLTASFCEHATALKIKLQTEVDAATLMDLPLGDPLLPPPPAPPLFLPKAAAPQPAQFRPRLILKPLGRGDGVLLRPRG